MVHEIFLSNLPYQASEQDIHRFMTRPELGIRASRIRMIHDRDSGKFRGFAFAYCFISGDPEKTLEQIYGSELMGRGINVEFAKPRAQVCIAAPAYPSTIRHD